MGKESGGLAPSGFAALTSQPQGGWRGSNVRDDISARGWGLLRRAAKRKPCPQEGWELQVKLRLGQLLWLTVFTVLSRHLPNHRRCGGQEGRRTQGRALTYRFRRVLSLASWESGWGGEGRQTR